MEYIPKHSLPFFFILCSYFQNNECKKISKFERDDKSNGIPLLQHRIFFSLSQEFFYIHSERFFTFFLCCVRISRIMNAKKISKFEREDERNEIPLLQHAIFFFLSREFSCEHSQRFLPIFCNAVLVFLE